MRDNRISFKAIGLLLLLGMIWGSGYVLARYATTNGVSPLGYSFWQSLGPALLVSLSCAARGFLAHGHKVNFSRQYIVYFLVCGAIGIAIPNTNMYFAAPHIPSNILAVLVNTVPVMIYVLALALRQERFHPWRLLGVICALAGILLIITPGVALPNAQMIPWVLVVLLSPLCFALCAIYIERCRPAGSYSLVLSAGMLTASSILLLPLVWFKHDFYLFHWPLNQADLAVLLEIALSSLGYVILFELLRIAGSVYYSLVGSVVVLTGLFWGWQIFSEKPNLYTCLAIALILLAIVLVTVTQENRRKLQEGANGFKNQ